VQKERGTTARCIQDVRRQGEIVTNLPTTASLKMITRELRVEPCLQINVEVEAIRTREIETVNVESEVTSTPRFTQSKLLLLENVVMINFLNHRLHHWITWFNLLIVYRL